MSDEIAKCWWCGGAQLWVYRGSIIPPQHQVACDGCYAWGPNADTQENAIAAWNAGPATQWHDIATAPQDRMVLVYAVEDPEKVPPECKGLEPLICTTKWHPDGGWCVCEVREATHWAELPKGPLP